MVSVAASSMDGELHKAWKRATNKIFKREYRSDYHRKGLYSLPQISIDSLDDVLKECLLDLGLFPTDREICADALLDIWVYVEKLQRHDAFAFLSELANRNLLNLTRSSRGSTTVPYGNASELYFSQPEGMKDLAFYIGHQDTIEHDGKRLFIEGMNFGSLEKWELLRDRVSNTQILSILTDPMGGNDWYNMNFPETEALLLSFTSTEYFLPPFLKSMKKLKFLMISNCGTNKATVKGLDVLSSLTQLKSVRLERLISPLGGKQSAEAQQKIEKLSFSSCEGFENIPTFTSLQDLNLDHRNDLELPLGIFNMRGGRSRMRPRKSSLGKKDIIVLSISVLIPANFALLPFIEDANPLVALLSALSSLVALFLFMSGLQKPGLSSAVLKTLLILAILLSGCSYLAIMATKLWAISKASAITLFVFGAMLVFGTITVSLSRSERMETTRPATTGAEAV